MKFAEAYNKAKQDLATDKLVEKLGKIAKQELGDVTLDKWDGYEVYFVNDKGDKISVNEKTFKVTKY